jgi:hydrogenase nickel incorporation protein HypA/HybF
MHELGIVLEMLDIVTERSRGAKVKRLVLEIGKLTAVLPDAVRFCFDTAAENTVAEGAALEIVEIPGMGRCRGCGGHVPLERPFGRCGCGGTDLDWIAGDELKIREMEVV